MQDERAQPDPIRTIELNKVLKLPPQLLQSLRNYKPAPIARPTIPKTALPQIKVIKPPIVVGVPNAIVQTVPIIITEPELLQSSNESNEEQVTFHAFHDDYFQEEQLDQQELHFTSPDTNTQSDNGGEMPELNLGGAQEPETIDLRDESASFQEPEQINYEDPPPPLPSSDDDVVKTQEDAEKEKSNYPRIQLSFEHHSQQSNESNESNSGVVVQEQNTKYRRKRKHHHRVQQSNADNNEEDDVSEVQKTKRLRKRRHHHKSDESNDSDSDVVLQRLKHCGKKKHIYQVQQSIESNDSDSNAEAETPAKQSKPRRKRKFQFRTRKANDGNDEQEVQMIFPSPFKRKGNGPREIEKVNFYTKFKDGEEEEKENEEDDEAEDPENVKPAMIDSDGKEVYAETCTLNKEKKDIPFTAAEMEKFIGSLGYHQKMRWADNFFRNEDPGAYYFASGIMQYYLTPCHHKEIETNCKVAYKKTLNSDDEVILQVKTTYHKVKLGLCQYSKKNTNEE